MKKTILTLALALCTISSAYAASNTWAGIKKDFQNVKSTIQKDINNVNSQAKRGAESSLSVQDEIDALKAKRDKELAPIKNQISAKEAQFRKIIFDTKMSASQKKSKTTLIQKELSTLKTKQKNIEESYRKQINELRYL